MAFDENPKIDESSKRSEESITMVKLLLNRKSNFLCREEFPDYGVDLDVELMNIKSNVSANKFAIQVKSVKSVKIITLDSEKFVSLQFKTSRLGYLCRRSPGYGIIILYNEEDQKLYFDYVEEIVIRLNKSRKDEKWKENEKVNINISVLNELNPISVNDIYQKMKNRFINYKLMLDLHGSDFNIPFGNQKKNSKSFSNDLELIAPSLINNQEFRLLYIAFEQIDNEAIYNSNKLCLYAAITYCEIGNVIEAKNFMTRCTRFKSEYSNNDIELLELCSPRIEFTLGNIDLNQFVSVLKELKSQIKSELNLINIELNLLQIKILNAISNNNYSELLELEILEYDKKIKRLKVNKSIIYSLQLVHSDSIFLYTNAFLTKSILKQMIKVRLGEEVELEDRKKILSRFSKLNSVARFNLNQLIQQSKKDDNKLLCSEVALRNAKSFLHMQTSLLICKLLPNYSELLKSEYISQINNLRTSYSIFINETRFFEAHFCLNYILEIIKLFEGYYEKKLLINDDILTEVSDHIKKIEKSTGIREYGSLVEEPLLNHKNRPKSNSFKETFLRIEDNEIEGLAQAMLEISDLPKERLRNIVIDIENHRKFYKRCKNSNLVLLQDVRHLEDRKTKYRTAPSYIIKNTKSGLETLSSSNIEELLEMIKYLNNADEQ